MKLREFAITHFPKLYQIYFEKATDRIIKKNKTTDIEKRKENLAEQYRMKCGHEMNVEHPTKYSDLMQWRKLYGIKPIYSTLSDKIAVQDWVKEKIGEEYLIPLLGVWDSFDEIDFDSLPDRFVLKTNNASATNVIVKDKSKMDKAFLRRKFNYWMKMEYWYIFGYEMQYEPIKPKILAEAYIEGTPELKDYKFLCFHGRVEYMWIDCGRQEGNHKRAIFDRDFNPTNYRMDYPIPEVLPEKPKGYEEMVRIADKLSEGFDHVRVDLYENNGKIYFGEMTFTSVSGLNHFHPEEFNNKLGKLWLAGKVSPDDLSTNP